MNQTGERIGEGDEGKPQRTKVDER